MNNLVGDLGLANLSSLSYYNPLPSVTHYSGGSSGWPSANELISWYFTGGGYTFERLGGEWGDLILRYPYTQSGGYFQSQFPGYVRGLAQSGARYGRVDYAITDFQFDPSYSRVYHYLNYGTITMQGSWYRYTNPNAIVLYDVTYTFHDKADLHPGRGYALDIVGTIVSGAYNLVTPQSHHAQPYDIRISTWPMTSIYYLNDNNTVKRIEGWPGPWPGSK
jgi:hypothetical protein